MAYWPGRLRRHDTGEFGPVEDQLFEMIFKYGRLDIIIFLYSKLYSSLYRTDNYYMSLAALEHHTHILDWFSVSRTICLDPSREDVVTPCILPSRRAYACVAPPIGDQDPSIQETPTGLETIRWLVDHKITVPNSFEDIGMNETTSMLFGICVAKTTHPKEIFPLMESMGWIPGREIANFAAGEGNIVLLEYLFTRGILMQDEGFVVACGSGNLEVLLWAKSKNLRPNNGNCIIEAVILDRIDIVREMISWGFVPHRNWLKHTSTPAMTTYLKSAMTAKK
jgi:hypothetical protein